MSVSKSVQRVKVRKMSLTENRYDRQKNFSLSESRFNDLNLEKKWKVYDNVNFSVHMGEACNADCQFCIAHLRYTDVGKIYQKPSIRYEKYLSRLEKIMIDVKTVNPSVSITGGEPTIFVLLPEVLKILKSSGLRKRTMTTNGSGLYWKVPGHSDTILDRLGDYELEHLNISRAHYDIETNKRIMRMEKDFVVDGKLKEIIKEAKIKKMKVRMSCALLNEGVNSVEEIKKYLDWSNEIGCDNVIFRQLMNFDEDRATGKIAEYCKAQSVDLVKIWEKMDKIKEYELFHTVLGYYYYVEVRKFDEMTVACEMADLKLIDDQVEKFSKKMGGPVAFEMVYHPNGNLCSGWLEDRGIMSEYQDGEM